MAGPIGGGTASVGFFGKLPGAGDFVQRRLPASFVERWDRHFEQAVHASREALGEDWPQAWRGSPLWRFVLAPQVCGEGAWAGVLGPAEDRVGRHFPMVMAAPVATAQIGTLLRSGAGWFDALARVHAHGQHEATLDAAGFDALVTSLPAPEAHLSSPDDGIPAIDFSMASHWRLPLPTRAIDGAVLAALWQRLSGGQGGWCLWWSEGAGRMPAAMLATQGLPAPEAYAGLLDAAHATCWQTPGVRLPDEMPVRVHEAPVPARQFVDDDITVPGVRAVAVGLDDHAIEATTPRVQALQGAVVVRDPAMGLTLVAADAGMPDPRRRAAAAVAGAVAELAPAEEAAPGTHTLRARLMALHPHLRHAGPNEDGAVIAARLAGTRAGLLRIGAAGAWHWRAGRLRRLFAAAPAHAPLPGGGELDDLLFGGDVALPGLGGDGTPLCEQLACELLPGDRLALLAGAPYAQLSPALLAQALAAPSPEEAMAALAHALDAIHPRPWPLAVLEVQP